jgi:hypothetical protein
MTIICYVYCIYLGLLDKVLELLACTDNVQFAERSKSTLVVDQSRLILHWSVVKYYD